MRAKQRFYDWPGGCLKARPELEPLEDRTVPAVVGLGLVAQYFDGMNLTGLAAVRQDPTVNFDWTGTPPEARIAPETYSVRWTGKLQPLYSEEYTFETLTADGVRLWVDGQLLIDQWHDQGATTDSGKITLEAGRLYNIRLEAYENTGPATVQLRWSSASQTREVIPGSRLFSEIHGMSQYVLTSMDTTWKSAEAEAAALGGHLLTLNDADEERWVRETFGQDLPFWLGLNDAAEEGRFVWSSGQTPGYLNFSQGEPNNYLHTPDGEDYVGMNFHADGQWNDYADGDHLWGIIEIPLGEGPIDSPPPGVPKVRSATLGTSRYITTTIDTTWKSAEAEAIALGGHLLTLNDAAEELWVRRTFGHDLPFWLGLNDAAEEGRFVWSSGQTPGYLNFNQGEPNNYLHTPEGEDYVGMNFRADGKWNDFADGDHLWGIIEIPIENGPPSGLALSVGELLAEETGGAVSIGIARTGGLDRTLSVQFRTVDASAKAGLDYAPVSGTAIFHPGETLKTITIPILDDLEAEGSETFSFVIDNVTGDGSLLAPRTATITIRDDEVPISRLFDFATFNDFSALALNGDATLIGGALRLTPIVTGQAGGAYHRAPLEVTSGTSFSTRFSFRIAGGAEGSDGLTFVLQNAPSGPSALGSNGGGLGYSGITPSLAVEFDTHQNAHDPDSNHVSVLVNGDVASPLGTTPAPVDINGGGIVYSWIDYDANARRLNLFVSPTAMKPALPTLSQAVNLAETVGDRAFLGFTAGTGLGSNAHEILDWEFSANTRLLPLTPQPPSVNTEKLYQGLFLPTAIDWSSDGRNLYIAELLGTVRVVRDGHLLDTYALDFRDRVNGTRDRGLLDIAVHPDLASYPYLYLSYTYDPPEAYQYPNDPLAGPDQKGNRPVRITRVTLDAATNYTTVVPDSEVILVGKNSIWANVDAFKNSTSDFTVPPSGILPDGTNIPDFIATDSESHSAGAIEFGKDGMLYATLGDGTSYNRADPRTVRVQDIDNLSGKLLRIDPITGEGPADNPFFNGDPNANRSKVYQLGLRNAFRMGIDPETGTIYLGDVGWTAWEEINTGPAGANFGWPFFEGGVGDSLRTGEYQDLPAAQPFYASGIPVRAPALALSHLTDGINAIVLGDVYRGSAYPSKYDGAVFYNDLARGIVKAVTFDPAGQVTSVLDFTTGANLVIQMKVGPDGLLYFVDLDDGTVGRWVIR